MDTTKTTSIYSTQLIMEPCYFCKNLDEAEAKIHTDSTAASSTAASKAAKERADSEAKEGVQWIDVYMMYYRAAFEHEYRRRSYMKREEVMNKLLETRPPHEDVCYYHSENVAWYNGSDKSVDHNACQKELRIKFEKSKWPNPLEYNENGRIGPR